MNRISSTRRLCRAGIIAALYTALSYAFAPLAFGPLQVRPAEALCILALFYIETIPALYVGCVLTNLASPFLFYDVFIGSAATLIAAICSYFVGKSVKNIPLKIALGGLFPVLFNGTVIPFIIVFLCGGGADYASLAAAYFACAGSVAFTEAIWVYALGTPLYLTVAKLRKKSVRIFLN